MLAAGVASSIYSIGAEGAASSRLKKCSVRLVTPVVQTPRQVDWWCLSNDCLREVLSPRAMDDPDSSEHVVECIQSPFALSHLTPTNFSPNVIIY
jgi:hypothetical protein